MAGCAIDVRNASKAFGETRSLDGLSLTVATGSVVGLLGPNGAGKTTTLRVLLGLVRLDAGKASVLDLDPGLQGSEVRRRLGVVLERDGLYGRLSAAENLVFHARIWHLPAPVRDRRMRELLGAFGLWDRRLETTAGWSKGMRQRLAIARALLAEPQLLLLDEPFAGLDPAAAAELRERIAGLARDRGVTVLLATHDLAHVEKLCSDVVIMRGGRVVAQGTPDGLTADGGPVEMLMAADGLDEEALRAMQQAGVLISYRMAPKGRTKVSCPLGGEARVSAELARRGLVIRELRVLRSSLEDVFLSVVSPAGESES